MFFPFSRFVVSGHSMQPFLNPGQQVLTFNWFYIFSCPKIGDVIVFTKNTQYYIKRVQKVSSRQIFVSGDNQADSKDSRKFGPINQTDVIGKVIYILNS